MPPTGGLRTAFSFRVAASSGGNGGPWRSSFQPSGAMFSPGTPIAPNAPQPVRTLDFNVGVNTVATPRASAPFSFAELRGFANVEPVRLAIETVKDQVERLDWSVRPRHRVTAEAPGDVAQITRFFAHPDGVTPFATWLRALLEDLLVLDAPRRRRSAGTARAGWSGWT